MESSITTTRRVQRPITQRPAWWGRPFADPAGLRYARCLRVPAASFDLRIKPWSGPRHRQPATFLSLLIALTLFVLAASPFVYVSVPMASIAGSALSFARPVKATGTNSLAFAPARKGNAFLRLQPMPMRFAVSCAAKQETVDKVCNIVKKQLALADDAEVSGASKFSELGADSLDTVEIVMGLEEEFNITVEESSAQTIATVEDAAELIDKLVAENSS